jgi:hypothetical protein
MYRAMQPVSGGAQGRALEQHAQAGRSRSPPTAAQCKHAQLERCTSLRAVLSLVGIAEVSQLHCCVMKLLRSPPGAARQKLHCDVPTHAVVGASRTAAAHAPLPKKAPQCVSIVLHLNPEPMPSTHVPRAPVTDGTPSWSTASSSPPCDEEEKEQQQQQQQQQQQHHFVSHDDMHGGDLLLFFSDVAHFGPTNALTSNWRWVLFVMFSPEAGSDQDGQQTFLTWQCGGKPNATLVGAR